jgi:5-methylcytosine-specific restriction endonuclease McrA
MKKTIQIQIIQPVVKKIDGEKDADAYDHRHEITVVNETFLGGTGEAHTKYNALISKKRTGYKQQDVVNKIYDPRWFVTIDEITELLVASKLKCFYCRTNCWVNYTEPHCSNQWTLDRISNDQGHNRHNVVISCLKCNLDRGTKSSDRFKLGKQFTFVKI